MQTANTIIEYSKKQDNLHIIFINHLSIAQSPCYSWKKPHTHTIYFLLGEGKENHLKFSVERYKLLLTLIFFTFTTQHQAFIIFLPLLLYSVNHYQAQRF